MAILGKDANSCQGLPRQQRHTRRHKRSRDPLPPVHLLMQEDFRCHGVADEGEASGGGSDQARPAPGFTLTGGQPLTLYCVFFTGAGIAQPLAGVAQCPSA